MAKKQEFVYHLHEMLLRYHRYLGLSHKQFILLHTWIQFDDIYMIEDITGFTEDQIIAMLTDLMERNIIQFDQNNEINLKKLYETLQHVEKTALPFRDVLIYEYKNQKSIPSRKHIGHVELVPMQEGIAVRLQNGLFLSLRQTLELSQELHHFAQSMKEEELQQLNLDLYQEQEKKKRETS